MKLKLKIILVFIFLLFRVYISNSTSGYLNPITWEQLGHLTLKWSRIYPTKKLLMYPYFKYRKSFLFHDLTVYLLHYIPAILMDSLSLIQGGKRKMVLPIAKKFRQACLAGEFIFWFFGKRKTKNRFSTQFPTGKCFSLNEWIFLNNRRYYYADIVNNNAYSSLDWNLQSLNYDNYIRLFVIGIQQYLHHEHDVRKQRNKFKITK